jgi:hypothetical protein
LHNGPRVETELSWPASGNGFQMLAIGSLAKFRSIFYRSVSCSGVAIPDAGLPAVAV